MTRVLVRPAGSGRETRWVAALCAAILVAASTTAWLRARSDVEAATPSSQIDARDGLNAAEQGVNADLAAAADEIRAAMSEGEPPSPERLAGDALPPFARDATSAKRGGHGWSLVRDGATAGYLGATAAPETARSLLLRLAPGDDHGHEQSATVWAHDRANAVDGLSDERLIASGWRRVTSRYDASVTRETK